jgi:hypothetical protein
MALISALLLSSAALAQEASFENNHYSVVVSKASGGLLQSLVAKPSGDILAQGMFLYTDYGVYETRGFVATGAASADVFDARREAAGLTVHAEGKLLGAPAEGKPPVRYRIDMTFDQSPVLHISAAVQPGEDKRDVAGFMALAWQIPSMASFRVRTIDGLLRHLYRDGEEPAGRAYSHWPPLDPVRPLVAFTTKSGASVSIANLRWSGVPEFTGPIVHGRTFFLCWLDNSPRNLKAGQWAQLDFDLEVSPPPR